MPGEERELGRADGSVVVQVKDCARRAAGPHVGDRGGHGACRALARAVRPEQRLQLGQRGLAAPAAHELASAGFDGTGRFERLLGVAQLGAARELAGEVRGRAGRAARPPLAGREPALLYADLDRCGEVSLGAC